MFESHFGFSGPPFQLNADPAFFFGSRGHSHALAYMRFGVHQAEGFIVVTGEVGAGKTTLVRTLMAGLEQDRVVAAQVVSTQLEAGDLLRAILAAFGVAAPATASKAQLISSLEAFLTALAAQGRRALLVIDEAQNLDRAAVEELRMLSNFQLGTHGLLQSFLVGQPELRKLLQSRSMEQLRQRVIASCHLGPLDESETRAYIEHRLRLVGWTGRPGFDDEAFVRIHRWTGGIPRRINRLCSRLLLGAYLAGTDRVSDEDVERTAQELGSEIGEGEPAIAESGAGAASMQEEEDAGSQEESDRATQVVVRAKESLRSALFCWVDTLADYLKSGLLAQAMSAVPGMPPLVAVHGGNLEGLLASLDDDGRLPRPDAEVGLDVPAPDGGRCTRYVTLVQRFAAQMEQHEPRALITLGTSDDAVLCGLLANKSGVPLVRADAGRLQRGFRESMQANAVVLDRIADVLYADSLVSYHALHKAGVAAGKLQCVGDLTTDVLHQAQARLVSPEQVLSGIGPAAQRLWPGRGYGVVLLQSGTGSASADDIERVVTALAPCAAETTLLWLVDESLLESPWFVEAEQRWRSASVKLMPTPGYMECLSLLREAEFFVTMQPDRCVDEALGMGVPVVLVGREGVMPLRPGDAEPIHPWQPHTETARLALEVRTPRAGRADRLQAREGGAAPRIASHLQAWLLDQQEHPTMPDDQAEFLRSKRT
ncbi:MAG: NACHT domain-containing protein [Burkholderiaceae bacterium]|nr:MAG: NACHT domain-containing protein [Burkholderiaceae bacterium]